MHQTTYLEEEISKSKTRKGYLMPIESGPSVLIKDTVTIGRDEDNTIQVNDPFVSAVHCQIEKRSNGFFIRDLKSTNGTRVNRMKISEVELINGSEIQIGQAIFIFKEEAPVVSFDPSLPLYSKNKKWLSKIRTLPGLAQSELPIFLQGASGVGKEVIAGIIHDLGPRRSEPFISVNCSALTDNLVESELFGHVKGSFTGAASDRKGAFESARGGTLFLDEIGDLPLSLQPKLLRALENQEIKPVGSDRIVKTDVRVISATHKNLENLVIRGEFREDLFFRINVVHFQIPSLRDRMEDFEDLLYHFSRETRVCFSASAISDLKRHLWPGNVRELKNTVGRASALFPQKVIQPADLPLLLSHSRNLFEVPSPLPPMGPGQPAPVMKEVEKELIRSRLAANRGNQRKTAVELGIPKSTLHDRIRLYNLDIKTFK